MWTITVTKEDKEYNLVLNKPTRSVYGKVINYMPGFSTTPNLMLAGELIIRECVIEDKSDMIILDDEDMMTTACISAIGTINLLKSELKKN